MSIAKRYARRVTAMAATVALMGGAGAMAADATAIASSDRVTSTTAVNVRSGPGTDHAILGGLYPGYTVKVRGASRGGWTPVVFNGHDAWISTKYLHRVGSGSAPVATGSGPVHTLRTTAALNVRTGPSTRYRIVTVLARGSSVSTTGETSHGYSQIHFAGADRWVATEYLTSGASHVSGTATKIATVALDVRSVPTTVYTRWAEIPTGGKVTVTGVVRNGRAQIVWGKGIAWVTAKYLKSSGSSGGSHALPRVTGHRYATTALMIRTTSGSDFRNLGDVPTGTRLSITGTTEHGRAQIVYKGAVRWVTARYLSTHKPSASSSGGSAAANGGTSSSRGGAGIVAYAQRYLGTPYSYGGGSLTGPSRGIGSGSGVTGFDCSGLTRAAVYAASGGSVVLPRTTYDQVHQGRAVSNGAREPGDLVFFKIDGYSWGHVGIYIGGGKMIAAPRPGQDVQVQDITSGYYRSLQQTTRRIL